MQTDRLAAEGRHLTTLNRSGRSEIFLKGQERTGTGHSGGGCGSVRIDPKLPFVKEPFLQFSPLLVEAAAASSPKTVWL
jgi:hypothetical protein